MTSFNEVYGYFLNSITDYTYLELQPDDLENELLMLLQKALGKLRRIKFDINLDNKTFKSILTSREINIISLAMVIEYIRPKIVSVEIMKQRLNIKDWQMFSNIWMIRIKIVNGLYRNLEKKNGRKWWFCY